MTKSEVASEGLETIYATVVRRAVEADNVNEVKVSRSLFQKMTGGRDKTMQETGHLAVSFPMVHCSHSFQTTNLISTTRRVIGKNNVPIINVNSKNVRVKLCVVMLVYQCNHQRMCRRLVVLVYQCKLVSSAHEWCWYISASWYHQRMSGVGISVQAGIISA